MIAEIGLPYKIVAFHQPSRKRGITKNNFYTLYDLAMLGITNHSKVPLRLATSLGFLVALFSAFVGFGYLIYKWSSGTIFRSESPRWSSEFSFSVPSS